MCNTSFESSSKWIWTWLFQEPFPAPKKWFFLPPLMSFRFQVMIFGMKGLEMDTYKPPKLILWYSQHMVSTSWPKWPRRPKTAKIWKNKKIAVISAKSNFLSKKSAFCKIEWWRYQTLLVDWTTLVRLFHPLQRFSIDYLFVEKIDFLRQKIDVF